MFLDQEVQKSHKALLAHIYVPYKACVYPFYTNCPVLNCGANPLPTASHLFLVALFSRLPLALIQGFSTVILGLKNTLLHTPKKPGFGVLSLITYKV